MDTRWEGSIAWPCSRRRPSRPLQSSRFDATQHVHHEPVCQIWILVPELGEALPDEVERLERLRIMVLGAHLPLVSLAIAECQGRAGLPWRSLRRETDRIENAQHDLLDQDTPSPAARRDRRFRARGTVVSW